MRKSLNYLIILVLGGLFHSLRADPDWQMHVDFAGGVLPHGWTMGKAASHTNIGSISSGRAEARQTDQTLLFSYVFPMPILNLDISFRGQIQKSSWGSSNAIVLYGDGPAAQPYAFLHSNHGYSGIDRDDQNFMALVTGEQEGAELWYTEDFGEFSYAIKYRWHQILVVATSSNTRKELEIELPPGFGRLTKVEFHLWHTTDSGTTWIDDIRMESTFPDGMIVLTHGFQPDSSSVEEFGSSRLRLIRDALITRLKKEGLQDSVYVYEFTWPEAFTIDYLSAERAVAPAGNRLAFRLDHIKNASREETGRSFSPIVHFIGHSLGTLLNAQAVYALNKNVKKSNVAGLNVAQFTILDSPLLPSLLDPIEGPREFFHHEPFFHSRLSGQSVGYLENIYGTRLLSATPAFGQQIRGAGPCEGGTFCGGLATPEDHIGVISFYSEAILFGDTWWGTTVQPFYEWVSPILTSWEPPFAWDGASARLLFTQELRHEELVLLENLLNADPRVSIKPRGKAGALGIVMKLATDVVASFRAEPDFEASFTRAEVSVSAPEITEKRLKMNTLSPMKLAVRSEKASCIVALFVGEEEVWRGELALDSEDAPEALEMFAYVDAGSIAASGNVMSWKVLEGSGDLQIAIDNWELTGVAESQFERGIADTNDNGLFDSWELMHLDGGLGGLTDDENQNGWANGLEALLIGRALQEDDLIVPYGLESSREDGIEFFYFRAEGTFGTLLSIRNPLSTANLQWSEDMETWEDVPVSAIKEYRT